MTEQLGLFGVLPRTTPFMELQRNRIDRELRRSWKQAPADPILDPRQARIASMGGSLQKRHGRLLEGFIRDAVATLPEVKVWREARFQVTPAADALAHSMADSAEVASTSLPYGAGAVTLEIDMLVYWPRQRILRAYEIKRANGPLDHGKTVQTLSNLRRVQILLKSYGEQNGYDVATAESRLICFYGTRTIGPPWSILGCELDNHFGFSVLAMVEEANAYLRQQAAAFAEIGP